MGAVHATERDRFVVAMEAIFSGRLWQSFLTLIAFSAQQSPGSLYEVNLPLGQTARYVEIEERVVRLFPLLLVSVDRKVRQSKQNYRPKNLNAAYTAILKLTCIFYIENPRQAINNSQNFLQFLVEGECEWQVVNCSLPHICIINMENVLLRTM